MPTESLIIILFMLMQFFILYLLKERIELIKENEKLIKEVKEKNNEISYIETILKNTQEDLKKYDCYFSDIEDELFIKMLKTIEECNIINDFRYIKSNNPFIDPSYNGRIIYSNNKSFNLLDCSKRSILIELIKIKQHNDKQKIRIKNE